MSKKSALRVAATVAAILGMTSYAMAESPRQINVPAGDLLSALKTIAMQADVELVFQPEQLKGLRTNGVSGSLSTQEAVKKLLQGTGLQVSTDAANGAMMIGVVEKPTAQGVSLVSPIHMAQASANEAASSTADSRDIDEVRVVTSRIVFTKNDAFGATKMGMSLLDTPQTVTVITSDMMEALNIRNLDDVNRVLPGSSRTYDFMGNENFYFRGFQNGQDNSLRVDGFRMPSETKLNPLLFDRIEIIQGATSTIYGQNNPAGTINVVSKVPEKQFALRLRADAGSNDYYNAAADVTGPLGQSGWAYRAVVGKQEYGTQYDHSKDDKLAGALSLQYEDDVKRFLVRVSHQDRDATAMRNSYFQFDRALPAGANVANLLQTGQLEIVPLQGVDRSLYVGLPWSYQDEQSSALQLQFDYKFTNDWAVRTHFQKSKISMDVAELGHWGPISFAGASERERLSLNVYNDASYGMELNLFGPFEAFGRRHTLFLGVDYALAKQGDATGNELNFGVYGANYVGTRFNIYAPDYDAYSPADLATFPGASSVGRTRSGAELVYAGFTGQLVFNPIERLSLLLGARYSYDTSSTRNVTGTNVTPETIAAQYAGSTPAYQQYRKTVGQGGITYEIFKGVNLYASYGQSFTPTNARQWVDGLTNGRVIGSQDGENTEVGVKAEVGAWNARVSLFDAQRTNIVESDLAHPGFSLPIGNQTGRGVEGALQGQLVPRLNVFAGAAYLDAEYRKGQLAGMRPPNAPKVSVSLFSTYELGERLAGFGFGVGVTHKRDLQAPDSRYRNASGGIYSVEIGDITEVDARVFYARDDWDFTVSASNLTNERYVTASNTNLIVNTHINPGREFRAGLRYVFKQDGG